MKKLKIKKVSNKKVGAVKSKSVPNKFVLTIGEEGAILAHYDKGKLENRIFVDSPYSQEIQLIQKLFNTYSKTPIYMLVDVVEQNYTQQVLPPVSSMALKGQVKRRMEKELRAEDFNNYVQLGRQKEGRKDWNFLFISLANTDPFAQWFEFVMKQQNDFEGVYLLPVESQDFLKALSKFSVDTEPKEWELLVLHNKIGGFRIVAIKDKKIIFTRQAQQLIGNNIPDVIVGNLEQEIVNTIEYLKRLGFKSEAESKITIVAGSDILQRVEKDTLGFAVTDMYTPYQAADKLGLSHSLDEADKFADIVATTFFAVSKKHVLKFQSSLTKQLDMIRAGTKTVYLLGLLGFLALSFMAFEEYQRYEKLVGDKKRAEVEERQSKQNLTEMRQKKESIENQKDENGNPLNIDKMIDVLLLSKNFSREKELVLEVITEIGSGFSSKQNIGNITVEFRDPEEVSSGNQVGVDEYNVYAEQPDFFGGAGGRDFKLYDAKAEQPNREIPKDKDFKHTFKAKFSFTYDVPQRDLDLVGEISENFLNSFSRKFPNYKFSYAKELKAEDLNKTPEAITGSRNVGNEIVSLEAEIEVEGVISEEKKADN